MASIDQLTQLKAKVEKLKSSRDKAVGVLENGLKTLKESWGCDTIEDAQVLLKKMKKEATDLTARFDEKMAEFMEKWGDKLK